jgi:hypothetical protein
MLERPDNSRPQNSLVNPDTLFSARQLAEQTAAFIATKINRIKLNSANDRASIAAAAQSLEMILAQQQQDLRKVHEAMQILPPKVEIDALMELMPSPSSITPTGERAPIVNHTPLKPTAAKPLDIQLPPLPPVPVFTPQPMVSCPVVALPDQSERFQKLDRELNGAQQSLERIRASVAQLQAQVTPPPTKNAPLFERLFKLLAALFGSLVHPTTRQIKELSS